MPLKKPKLWLLISRPVAWVNSPPNLTSSPDRVKPLEAVVDSKVPDAGQEVRQSVDRHKAPATLRPEEKTPAEVTVKDDPTPTLPVRLDSPATVKVPPSETGEPDTVSPVPAVADTVMAEFSSSEFWMEPAGKTTDPPVTAKPPDNTVPEVTVKLWPIPTLPETFMEDPIPKKPEK